MNRMDQPTQSSREESDVVSGSGRQADEVRNRESSRDQRSGERPRPAQQDDLILHDDDEAELELPR